MKKLIILVIAAVIMVGVCSSNDYVEIPSTSIRMRVIANSDSEKDQSDKKSLRKQLKINHMILQEIKVHMKISMLL